MVLGLEYANDGADEIFFTAQKKETSAASMPFTQFARRARKDSCERCCLESLGPTGVGHVDAAKRRALASQEILIIDHAPPSAIGIVKQPT